MKSKSQSKSGASPEAISKTLRAFVLIQTVPGRLPGILRILRRLPSVRTAESVTGPYDIVALVEVGHPRELASVVAGYIGGIRGVSRTTTLLCTE